MGCSQGFSDGELAPSERVEVERHLSACKDCTMRVADLRAESGLVRLGMEFLADEADFTDFAQKVMARVTPEKPPFFERLKLSVSEMLEHQRRMMASIALGGAAVAAAAVVAVVVTRAEPHSFGYANPQMMVQSVQATEQAHVAPVVMTSEKGDAIIWLVHHEDHPGHNSPGGDADDDDEELKMNPGALDQQRPSGGEL